MKLSVIFVLMLFPAIVLAQNYQNMDQVDMQKMMVQLEQMQTCMENIDQAKIEELSKRAQQVDDELKALCAEGKRDAAQAKAIAFGEEFAKDPTLLAMKKCGEMAPDLAQDMPFDDEEDYTSHHVCDQQ